MQKDTGLVNYNYCNTGAANTNSTTNKRKEINTRNKNAPNSTDDNIYEWFQG